MWTAPLVMWPFPPDTFESLYCINLAPRAFPFFLCIAVIADLRNNLNLFRSNFRFAWLTFVLIKRREISKINDKGFIAFEIENQIARVVWGMFEHVTISSPKISFPKAMVTIVKVWESFKQLRKYWPTASGVAGGGGPTASVSADSLSRSPTFPLGVLL